MDWALSLGRVMGTGIRVYWTAQMSDVTWDNMLDFVTLAQAYRRSERREGSAVHTAVGLASWQ